MTKKQLVFFTALVAVLVFSITACGQNAAEPTDEESTAGEDVTISFIHWRGEDTGAFDQIIADFENEYPNIRIEMNAFPSDQYESTLQSRLMGGNSGDVFAMFPGVQFEAITSAGLAQELDDEEVISRFHEHLIEMGEKDGKQYGLPLQLVFNIPIYNKTMFEEFGIEVPIDWEGFLAVAETLKENGIENPIIFPAGDNGPGQFMNPMMMNNELDEGIWEDVQSGERKVTEEWWVKTLTQIKELNDNGYFGSDPLGVTQDASGTLFAQERGGMLAMGSYMMAQVVEQNPDMEVDLLAPITVSEDEAVYEGIHTTTFMLSINSESEHQEEAKKFIEFLTRPDQASLYANETGQHLTLKDVTYESRELQATEYWMEKNTRFQPRYLITNGQVQDAVIASIEEVLGGISPEDAAETAQAIIDRAIQ